MESKGLVARWDELLSFWGSTPKDSLSVSVQIRDY